MCEYLCVNANDRDMAVVLRQLDYSRCTSSLTRDGGCTRKGGHPQCD